MPASSVTLNSASSITVVTPAHAPGGFDVRVVNQNGISPQVDADAFTFVGPAPAAVAGKQRICGRVPTLLRHTLRGVRFILKRDGCASAPVDLKLRPDRHHPVHVKAQTPAPGTALYAGNRITITVG